MTIAKLEIKYINVTGNHTGNVNGGTFKSENARVVNRPLVCQVSLRASLTILSFGKLV